MKSSSFKVGGAVCAVQILGGGIAVTTGGGPGVAARFQIWSLDGETLSRTREFELSGTSRGGIDSAIISPDGKTVFAKRGVDLLQWNTETQKLANEIRTKARPGEEVHFAFASNDGPLVMTADGGGMLDCFDAKNLRRRDGFPMLMKSDPIRSLASMSRQPGRVLVVSRAGAIGFVDLEAGRHESAHLETRPAGLACISPDGKTLAVAESDTGTLQLWNPDARLRFFDFPVTQSWEQIFFDKRGDLLVGRAHGGDIYIWRAPFAE
jgi:WD40 repeat protein